MAWQETPKVWLEVLEACLYALKSWLDTLGPGKRFQSLAGNLGAWMEALQPGKDPWSLAENP